MDKRFWAILGVIAVIIIGVFWITNDKKAGTPNSTAQASQHTLGHGAKGVTLLEYGDYECPYCAQYYSVVKQVVDQYQNDITFQFRNLPLTQIHPNAFASARAAEAAGLQNKFWEMHDYLYAHQQDWVNASNPSTIFGNYAIKLGLNADKFKQDYASEQVNGVINADVAAFNKTGAQEATPAFFLDGKQVNPTISMDSFKQLLDAEIAKKASTTNKQ